MTGAFALPYFDFSMLPTSRPIQPQAPLDHSTKLQQSLETLFPDLLVHGTRSGLLNMTTSITKVSGRANSYFAKLSQALAFDRMMRNFMWFTAAVSPFAMNFGAANCWSNPFLPSPQAASPWGFPAQTPKPAPANPFFPAAFQPQATVTRHASAWASPANPFYPAVFQPQPTAASQAAVWADYNTMMIVPLTLLAAAPELKAMWGLNF